MVELGPHATHEGRRTMACTVDHRASGAADHVLRRGGSAVDAAIAASAVVAVTCPHLCGMGGDLLALVHDGDDQPATLDATGAAGRGADPDRVLGEGHASIPHRRHPAAVTVPGCVDGWVALHERFGVLALDEVLADATALAAEGFVAPPLLRAAVGLLADAPEPAAQALRDEAGAPGAVVRRPGVASALAAVAREGRDGFYRGAFGEGLLEVLAGEVVEDDLARSQARWVRPARLEVWGHTAWTTPPPSQGYLTLAGAWVLERLGVPDDPDDARWAHLVVEAAKQVGADRRAVLHEGADVVALLGEDRLGAALAAVDPERAAALGAPSSDGDTMHLCVADGRGQAVSLIQSTAEDFGSHLFEPRSGINLHNRGIGFRLAPGHPARLGPGRRPPSTLSPALVTDAEGRLRAVLGTRGGDTQPQILLQLLVRLLHHDERPGTAVAAPRLTLTDRSNSFTLWDDPSRLAVNVEGHAPASWSEGLVARGHDVVVRSPWDLAAGDAHVIERTPEGGWAGAADPRAGIGAALGR